jgi:hypothetical protein
VRKFTQLLVLIPALLSNAAISATPSAEDARFAQFVDRTLEEYWRPNPERAFAAATTSTPTLCRSPTPKREPNN